MTYALADFYHDLLSDLLEAQEEVEDGDGPKPREWWMGKLVQIALDLARMERMARRQG